MNFILAFFIAFILSVIFTLIVKKIAIHYKILDIPKDDRRIHKKPIPLLGGVAIFLSFTLVVLGVSFFTKCLVQSFGEYLGPEQILLFKHLLALIFGGAVIIIGGILDDKYDLPAKFSIIFPVIAVIIVIALGIGIDYVSNPMGGMIHLEAVKYQVITIHGVPYFFTPLADIFTLIWLMIMMYTTKLLDGMDGLVTGIGLIGALIIFVLSLVQTPVQPQMAMLSLIFAGSLAGFLVFNFNPAKIFLGEGGSLYVGFILGALSILLGSKVAVTLLILGLPALDIVWSIIRRISRGQNPFTTSDKKHLHHRFLNIGFSQKQTVLVFYVITIVFGASGIFMQTRGRLSMFLVLMGLMVCLLILLGIIFKIKQKRAAENK